MLQQYTMGVNLRQWRAVKDMFVVLAVQDWHSHAAECMSSCEAIIRQRTADWPNSQESWPASSDCHANTAEQQQHTWNKDLCKGHIVVRDKDHLEQVPNITVAVDLAADSIDHLDDLFGTFIPWSCLTTNDTCSGHHLHTLILLSSECSHAG